ncbi:MAG: DegT/DnrJ/EryC1/StrS family aminotransferase [Verrucomicrobiota bacterium]
MTDQKVTPIPVNTPLLDGNEKKYLEECIDTGWISSEGPFVERFEESLANEVSRAHGIAVANGTAALDIAVAALKIGPGDEVILPTFTIISCAQAVTRAGATPVTVDCDPATWNMVPAEIEAAVTPRTKAIMVVHIYGLPVDMDAVLDIAERHGLAIIEDAAEMLGQTYRDLPCGSFGDISTFSFYANKHVTTGEGGMVLTNDPQLADRCRSLRNLCFKANPRFVHEELGWNYRMTNLQAAVGCAQLEYLDKTTNRKRAIGTHYNQNLSELRDNLLLPVPATPYSQNIYWVYGLVPEGTPLGREEITKAMTAAKIGTRPFFWPIHEQPVFKEKGLFQGVSHPRAESLARQGFYLPSGTALTPEQLDRVTETLIKIVAS